MVSPIKILLKTNTKLIDFLTGIEGGGGNAKQPRRDFGFSPNPFFSQIDFSVEKSILPLMRKKKIKRKKRHDFHFS